MGWLCRDCLSEGNHRSAPARCPNCGSPRRLVHPELDQLSIAHIDCDAFYASVEKRDDPALRDQPVVIGGGRRGVVAAACYVARTYGIHSAMPMFKARAACPHVVVIKPNMAKYARIGRQIRAMMQEITPLVEPLSIDEAFLDLSGTDRLHGGSPARTLARLIRRIEQETGLGASVGLSYNKFLAKVASDLDKPRGFAVIGRGEALDFLADRPVGLIWGVGKSLRAKLARDGVQTIAQLRVFSEEDLIRRYGIMGTRLYRFARGEDSRTVNPSSPTKSVSTETTLDTDLADVDALSKVLWRLSEKLARRLKSSELSGQTVTLKLKTANFRLRTRAMRLDQPTQLADRLFDAGHALLERECDGERFRLVGIGASDLHHADEADQPDLLDPARARRVQVERAIDAVRAKLGEDAIVKGRSLPGPSAPSQARDRGGRSPTG